MTKASLRARIAQRSAPVRARYDALKARAEATDAGKALKRYGRRHGNVLAGGLAYYSLTSIAAGAVIVATLASTVVGVVPSLRAALQEYLARALPGVISTSDADGLITASALNATAASGLVGAAALVVLFFTATRYVGGLRAGVRSMLGRRASSMLIGKLRDFGALLGIALIVVVGVLMQVAASRALGWVAAALSFGDISTGWVRAVAMTVGLVADALFVLLALVLLGRANAPRRELMWVALSAAALVGVLRVASSLVVGGTLSNPVLAPFAAVVTLMVFVDLVARIVLLAAAWVGARRPHTE